MNQMKRAHTAYHQYGKEHNVNPTLDQFLQLRTSLGIDLADNSIRNMEAALRYGGVTNDKTITISIDEDSLVVDSADGNKTADAFWNTMDDCQKTLLAENVREALGLVLK